MEETKVEEEEEEEEQEGKKMRGKIGIEGKVVIT